MARPVPSKDPDCTVTPLTLRERNVPRTRQREAGFSLVEMLVVLGVISILATVATVTLGSSTEKAYVTAMQSDLRMVSTAQEAYIERTFAETGRASYARRIQDLDVNLSNGVQVRLRGNATGWSARATHQRVPGARCAMYRGTVQAFPPAAEEGLIECD